MSTPQSSRVAVLVDCDNTIPEILEHSLSVVAQFGRVVLRLGYRMVIPSPAVMDAFNIDVSTLHDEIRFDAEKVQTLFELRDTLLPHLISGQLGITDLPEEVTA